MESALPMILFLSFLIGSTLLILICGMHRPDSEEDEAAAARPAELDVRGIPRFFGRPGQTSLDKPVVLVVDEAMVAHVEDFLRSELALAEVFVEDPSIERLHQRPPEPDRVRTLFESLEGYLRDEQRRAAEFLCDPSVESLYGNAAPVALPA